MLLSQSAILTRTVPHMTNYMSQTVLNIAIGYLAINKWLAPAHNIDWSLPFTTLLIRGHLHFKTPFHEPCYPNTLYCPSDERTPPIKGLLLGCRFVRKREGPLYICIHFQLIDTFSND